MAVVIDLPEFSLEAYLERWEFSAKYHLTASDAETFTIRELLDLASEDERAGFEHLQLGYRPTFGGVALREAIAATYERRSAEDVLCFAGGEEALFWALAELLRPGDHALVTVPNYQSMESVPIATGADVEAISLGVGDTWRLDLDELESSLRDETRVVAVNFPNNPTGFAPPPEAFCDLVRMCDRRGIILFSDEAYRGLELDGSRRLPQAADLSDGAISLNVTSKSYGLPGLRVGWLASGNRDLLRRLDLRKHYTSICNAAPSEFLATIALRNGEVLQARNQDVIRANLPIFDDFFDRWSTIFDWYHPDGGCVVFPRYLAHDDTSDFCQALVEQEGVVLLPGAVYESQLASVPKDRFRIGIGRRDPEPALEAFDRFLRNHVSA